jgi:hypothetical protein
MTRPDDVATVPESRAPGRGARTSAPPDGVAPAARSGPPGAAAA